MGRQLTHILVTHHHWDHTGGVAELKKATRCAIVGPDDDRTPALDHRLADSQTLDLGDITTRAIATPGHTRSSLCYFLESPREGPPIVWTGDTLFIGGCGRLLECDAETMWQSLQRLRQLPDETLVYPGHDYTEENYEFALTITPDSDELQTRLAEATALQQRTGHTAPSTIRQEKQTNLFLRADQPELARALHMPGAEPASVFAALRRRKDHF